MKIQMVRMFAPKRIHPETGMLLFINSPPVFFVFLITTAKMYAGLRTRVTEKFTQTVFKHIGLGIQKTKTPSS